MKWNIEEVNKIKADEIEHARIEALRAIAEMLEGIRRDNVYK